jgi:molybdate transport system regulatory protein
VSRFTARTKLWIENDGLLVMSGYRLRLLELVHETGSVARAATALRLSYRRAWGKLREMEENLGCPLIVSEVGGAGGGHTTLTPEGVALLRAFREYSRRVEEASAAAFADTLAEALSALPPRT